MIELRVIDKRVTCVPLKNGILGSRFTITAVVEGPSLDTAEELAKHISKGSLLISKPKNEMFEKTDEQKEALVELENPVEYCERKFPETTQLFKELQREDYLTFCKKQMDYGPGNIAMGTNLETEDDINFSLGALNIRVNDKIQRLLNLIYKFRRRPQNESIEDAYKDMSVYGLIARVVCNRKWNK